MGKPFTEEERSKLRTLMVQNARKAFESQPFNEVKVEQITKETGISKGAFYTFYKSKEELFIDVLIIVEEEMQQQIMQKIARQSTLRKQLKTILIEAIHTFEKGYLFKSFEDPIIQAAILSKATDAQREQMLVADRRFLEQLIADESSLKLDRATALDLLRSVFFILPVKAQLESPFETFISQFVSAMVDTIIHEEAPGMVVPKEGNYVS
ncbi:MAG: TetR/AcrR family transcriptional regulator [Firmicutes bacterium]|nr:TetR/AcrR family transcriptional regulator [Bacillota bacterium]